MPEFGAYFSWATSFSFVYGVEVDLPRGIHYQVSNFLVPEKPGTRFIRACFDQLNLMKEKKLKAICHGQMYQNGMIRSQDKKVHPREF
ncbi:hypothetical protein GQ457_08G035030 [Hibiscus cannabinus]